MSEQVVPSVTDWDEVYKYIKDNDAFYLLQRRMNAAPYRELLGTEEQVPGVEALTVKKLGLLKKS